MSGAPAGSPSSSRKRRSVSPRGRATVWLLAVSIGLGLPAAAFPLPTSDSGEGDRIALVLEFLAVGEGSRIVARHREVIDVGMTVSVEKGVERHGARGPVRSRCRVVVTTRSESGGRVGLGMRSVVVDAGAGRRWERERSMVLLPGTSSLVEMVPAGEESEGLVVSVSVQPAGDEPLDAPPLAVELRVSVYVVDGERETLVQEPHLRTLTGKSTSFSFDYPVPSREAHQVDRVRFEVRLTPGHPRRERLPIRVELRVELPGPDGPVRIVRNESSLVSAGHRWVLPVGSPSGAGPHLEIAVTAFWRPLVGAAPSGPL